MAQKSGLNFKRVLEFIGVVETSNETETNARRQRYEEEAYEEPRYTPPRSRMREEYDDYGEQREPRYDQRRSYRAPAEDVRRRPNPKSRPQPNQKQRPAPGDRGMVRSETAIEANTSTMVYYLHSLSECGDVIQDLIRGNSVFMNLEETDSAQMQRIVDTLAGATFALNAKIRKVSEKTYLIAPKNVSVNMTRSVERRY
ncbi:MAG: cell division protein SepF [Clostridia bacterium]|nr:cell division protein SepF [Clostridia bacterium]